MGLELKLFRIKKGMSQEKFAAEIGYSREHYRQIEIGARDYTVRFMDNMRSRFNLTEKEFLKIMEKDGK